MTDRKPPRPTPGLPRAEPEEMAKDAARAADARRGEAVLILDLRGRSQVADFFLLVTGKVEPQLAAIVEAVAERLAGLGCRPLGPRAAIYGGGWAVMDYGPLVIHAFTPEVRNYYDLELLWGDAPRIEWREDGGSPQPADAGPAGRPTP